MLNLRLTHGRETESQCREGKEQRFVAPFVPASSFRLRFFSFFAVCRSTAVPELVLYQSNFGDYLAVMS